MGDTAECRCLFSDRILRVYAVVRHHAVPSPLIHLMPRAQRDGSFVLKTLHEAIARKHKLQYSSVKSWPRPALIRLLPH